MILIAIVAKLHWDWHLAKMGHSDLGDKMKQMSVKPPLFFHSAEKCPSLLPSFSANTTDERPEESKWTHLPPSKVPPIFLPGYPGSGSELLRDLIPLWTGHPALDGQRSWNFKSKSACLGAVTCKTHWPTMAKQRNPKEMVPASHPTEVWVLLRNPLHAIPSYFSWHWEWINKIPGHTRQMPESYWITKRDAFLILEVDKWCELVRRWYDTPSIRSKPHSKDVPHVPGSFLIQYERLTHPSQGAAVVEQFRQHFLAAGYSMKSSSVWDMLCRWKAVVFDRPRVRRNKTYAPSYTVEQLTYIHQQLGSLHNDMAIALNLTDLDAALAEYIQSVEVLLRKATQTIDV